MTISLQGLSISRGIAIGSVHLIEQNKINVYEYDIKNTLVEDEISRLNDAISEARLQLRVIRDYIPKHIQSDVADFIDTHLLILDDQILTDEPKRIIREQLCNAEWALKLHCNLLTDVFDKMENIYLSERKYDIEQIINRVLRILLKQQPLLNKIKQDNFENKIVFAHDLTPADAVLMKHYGVVGFIIKSGGPTSHVAIIARSFGMPAIVGSNNYGEIIQEDDVVVIDANNGFIIIDNENLFCPHYKIRKNEMENYYSSLWKLKNDPARTIDNVDINLMASIGMSSDINLIKDVGAEGIGLYRTEFMYIDQDKIPKEEDHFDTYIGVLEVLQGLPLTIRTFDIGVDKQVYDKEDNLYKKYKSPALGLRAIRLCLRNPDLFKPQVRAIIRASAYGDVRIMIPMLTNTQEMNQVFSIIEDIKKELDSQSINYDRNIKIGGMIEIPAAAICADIFAKKLDFLSIGTNDLIQYTMAIDRVNDEVNYLYDPLHPAILRLISNIIKSGKQANIPVSMCGEMAADIEYTRLLLGLGLMEFSVHPAALLEIKQIIRNTNISELKDLADSVLCSSSGIDAHAIVHEKLSGNI